MRRTMWAVAVTAVAALALAACGGGTGSSSGAAGGKDFSKVASLADAGGMDALVAAAKAEGQLNVITLPDKWANYGAIMKAFSDKYGIKINSALPDGSSADEVNAVTSQKGQDRAPDVLDVGASFALQAAAQKLTAP